MKHRLSLIVLLLLALGLSFSAQADKKSKLSKEVQETIKLFKKTDPGMEKLFKEAKGYVVFPKVSKGAFGVGAAKGRGQLFAAGQLKGEATLAQVTIGFQLGGQVYAEVIIFDEEKALKDFQEGNLEFSAQVSAVAAAEGASANAKFVNGVAVFTIAKGGLMYEASVGGQKFNYEPYEK
jgi:lipid-binding SYLF domain-containing protein